MLYNIIAWGGSFVVIGPWFNCPPLGSYSNKPCTTCRLYSNNIKRILCMTCFSLLFTLKNKFIASSYSWEKKCPATGEGKLVRWVIAIREVRLVRLVMAVREVRWVMACSKAWKVKVRLIIIMAVRVVLVIMAVRDPRGEILQNSNIN